MSSMDKPIITETHVRKARMILQWTELQSLIKEAACKKCGIPNSDAVQFEIKIEQHREGSPSYAVNRWCASVTVIEDQTKLPRPAHDRP